MTKSFHVLIPVCTLFCAACSESTAGGLQAGAADDWPADIQDRLDQLPVDLRDQVDDMFAQFSTLFNHVDRNGDDAMSYDELFEINATFSDPQTGETFEGEAAAQAWLDLFDTDFDGKIGRLEMLNVIIRKEMEQKEMEQEEAEQ